MKAIPRIGAAMLGLALLAAPAAGQGARTSSRDSMTISRQGTRPARRGPEATLIVTAGTGRILRRGGPVEEIRAGDVIWTPPGVEHWHGASPETAMQHIAIQESLDRKVVDWLEHVTDEQYRGDRVAR